MQVFISYAHDDNRTPEHKKPDQLGWVDYFYEALETELATAGLRDVKIWRDKKNIERNREPDRPIIEGLKKSEVMISVVSPNYIQRPYCEGELDEFLQILQERGHTTVSEDVFKVLVRHVPRSKQPAAIRSSEGFAFYEPYVPGDEEDIDEKPLYRGFGIIVEPSYWDVLQDLANTLRRRLRSVDRDTVTAEQARDTVYLAQTADDGSDERRMVRFELKRNGFEVVPEKDLPRDLESAVSVIREALAIASASIHLLGATQSPTLDTGGVGPEDPAWRDLVDLPVAELQLKLAAEQATARDNFRRFIWKSRGLKAETPRQAQLLDAITEGGELFHERDELVLDLFEVFKEGLMDELGRKEDGRAGADTGRPELVVLLCRGPDEGYALRFQRFLSAAGYEPFVAVLPDDGGPLSKDASDSVARCTGIMVVFAEDDEEAALKQQLDQLADLKALGRDAPFAARAVLLAGARTDRKQYFSSPTVDVAVDALLDDAGEAPSDPPGLAAFLERLGMADGG